MRALGMVICALAVALGCRGDEMATPEPASEDGPSIVLEDFHTPDVWDRRDTWRDEESGLRFTTPDATWSRVEGPELRALGPDVRLAVRGGARCSGWALARAAGGQSARAAADAARAALAWDGLEVQVDEDVKYDLWTARRYEVEGRLAGRTTAERATAWLEDGRLYMVVGRTDERDYGSRRRCLDKVTAGFALSAR